MAKRDGGPAFPRPSSESDGEYFNCKHAAQDGMSLRDWFAGQALLALVSKSPHCYILRSEAAAEAKIVVTRAYLYADAMLKKREKTGGER